VAEGKTKVKREKITKVQIKLHVTGSQSETAPPSSKKLIHQKKKKKGENEGPIA